MKVGIIGMGSIGQRHASNLAKLGHEVIGLEQDASVLFATGVPRAIGPEQFWEFDPEAVFVCTPPDSHAKIAAHALAQGVHVFIEKPVTTTYRDALTLLDAQMVSAGPCVAVGYQLRFQVGGIRQLCPQRRLDIVNLQDMGAWPSKYPKDVLCEFSHEIDLAVFLNGPAHRVAALEAGDKGFIIMLEHTGCCSRIDIDGQYTGDPQRYVVSSEDDDEEWHFDQDENDQAYIDEAASFINACQGAAMAQETCSLVEAAHTVRIIEACRDSIRYHKAVSI